MNGLTEGRIVHYVLDEPYGAVPNEHRPSMIVKVWNTDGVANLQVFLDGHNDWLRIEAERKAERGDELELTPVPPYTLWRTSVKYSEEKEAGTWHWIEPA